MLRIPFLGLGQLVRAAHGLTLLLALAGPAKGQTVLNVERSSEEVGGAHLALEGAAELRAGNEQLTDLQGAVLMGYRWPRHWLRLLSGMEYLAEEGEGLVNARHIHLRYNRILGERWRTFHFVQLQANQALKLERRLLVGSGLRAAVLRRERHGLELGTGLMLEDERLNRSELAAEVEAHSQTVRVSNLAVYRHDVREGVEWLAITYHQPRLTEPGDFRLLQDFGLAVDLSAGLGLELRAEWRHDSRPPPGGSGATSPSRPP